MATLPLFCYGSNGSQQLANRLGRPVQGYQAYLEGYGRVYRGWSRNWQGGPASLKKTPGKTTYGSIVYVTAAELNGLDRFEGVNSGNYVRKKYNVEVNKGGWKTVRAVAYVSTSRTRNDPSQAYLVAVAKNVGEYWSGSDGTPPSPRAFYNRNPAMIDTREALAQDYLEMVEGARDAFRSWDGSVGDRENLYEIAQELQDHLPGIQGEFPRAGAKVLEAFYSYMEGQRFLINLEKNPSGLIPMIKSFLNKAANSLNEAAQLLAQDSRNKNPMHDDFDEWEVDDSASPYSQEERVKLLYPDADDEQIEALESFYEDLEENPAGDVVLYGHNFNDDNIIDAEFEDDLSELPPEQQVNIMNALMDRFGVEPEIHFADIQTQIASVQSGARKRKRKGREWFKTSARKLGVTKKIQGRIIELDGEDWEIKYLFPRSPKYKVGLKRYGDSAIHRVTMRRVKAALTRAGYRWQPFRYELEY